jgi:hypothetical protein
LLSNFNGKLIFIKNYIPITRGCVTAIINGVPFGAHIAWLSMSNTGMPKDLTRIAPVTHWAVTHGTGDPDTLNGQPATTYGAG